MIGRFGFLEPGSNPQCLKFTMSPAFSPASSFAEVPTSALNFILFGLKKLLVT